MFPQSWERTTSAFWLTSNLTLIFCSFFFSGNHRDRILTIPQHLLIDTTRTAQRWEHGALWHHLQQRDPLTIAQIDAFSSSCRCRRLEGDVIIKWCHHKPPLNIPTNTTFDNCFRSELRGWWCKSASRPRLTRTRTGCTQNMNTFFSLG